MSSERPTSRSPRRRADRAASRADRAASRAERAASRLTAHGKPAAVSVRARQAGSASGHGPVLGPLAIRGQRIPCGAADGTGSWVIVVTGRTGSAWQRAQ
jgi:hypothetical protein